MRRFRLPAGALLALALAVAPPAARSADGCAGQVGRFASLEGQVHIRSGDKPDWKAAKLVDPLCKGDTVRVGARSRAAIVLVNEAVMRLDQNTAMRLTDVSGKKEERSFIDVITGTINAFIRKPRLLSVNTPYLNGSIEGTEFQVTAEESASSILLLEGRILASNDKGSITITPGQLAASKAGESPVAQTIVRPRDAVQWSLYYPPINDVMDGRADPSAVLAELEKAPEAARDAAYLTRHASALLSLGRRAEASQDLDKALALDPKAGDAHALRALIHVVSNEKQDALREGRAAAESSASSAGGIALSYALQADFQIATAQREMETVVKAHPDDALAWARLSELRLMLGETGAALDAANKAAALAPDLARTQTVLGFAALAGHRGGKADAHFTRAVTAAPSDPMAHLGLGLAKVSLGDLTQGRSELEVAVALDANQSVLRAYLGKAYFEERRGPLDAQQFDIAKNLDPLDPTAFLYDGIRKQTENRPVEALDDIRQSMALNDNRAVYRGRLLLDKDQAARGASLARAFTDLGFIEQGVDEASDSLALDPSNASAHRFLADVYQGERRHEVARVSELMQAQMLQDVNLDPIQPSTAAANINIVSTGGPASAGFNEFTPLFQQNQTRYSLSAMGGNLGTTGLEGAVSGLYGRTALSFGAMTYDTDGWRPNNGLSQDLYDFFIQSAATDRLNLQMELSHRQSKAGDLAFDFDPNDYVSDYTDRRDFDAARVGLRYAFSPQSTLLASLVHTKRTVDHHEMVSLFDPGLPGLVDITNDLQGDERSDQMEAQFLHQAESMNWILGAAWNQVDRTDDTTFSVFDTLNSVYLVPPIPLTQDHPSKGSRAYGYLNLRPSRGVAWTLGGAFDDYKESTDQTYHDRHFSPKLGVTMDLRPNLRVRAAAFEVVKPYLANNRTLEPTQIAGFNQMFDDINGTRSRRVAAGLDWRPAASVGTGIELSRRTRHEPVQTPAGPPDNGVWITEESKEQYHRAYLDWTPAHRVAVHGELVYDSFRSEDGLLVAGGALPNKSVTKSLPVTLTYTDPSGIFTSIGATYVDQSVIAATRASGESRFAVVDAAIGYRLPKRQGICSLAVRNLFDRRFEYQDDSYREIRDEPTVGPYFPVRTVNARCLLNF